MSLPTSIAPQIASIGLIAAGAVVFASTGAGVATDKELKVPLNAFGINTSPYGEVLAMAMQGPVDVYWNNASGMTERSRRMEIPPDAPFRDRVRMTIEELEAAATERTNPNPASKAQSLFLKRRIEDKLSFAYELDPGHYANYNTYHFFLTEPAVGTHRQLNRDAAELAARTINYCLSRNDDPRRALTAAAATENMLQLMFNDRHNEKPRFTTAQMREQLALLDHCLDRFRQINAGWEKSGTWSLLSEQRRMECEDRLTYILKMRETCEKTIQRLESGGTSATSRTPSPTSFLS